MILDSEPKTPIISGRTAGLDWVTITGKHGMDDVEEITRSACVESPQRATDQFYTLAYRFPGMGVVVKKHNVSNDDSWLVSIPGTACSLFGDKLQRIVRDILNVGRGRFSRVDTAIDYTTDNGSEWLDHLGHLAERNQFSRHGGNNKTTKGHTVTLGDRKSETLVRIYDKGAETGGEWGRWIRYEAEFKYARAHELTKVFLQCDDWTETAHRVACGAIPEFSTVSPEYATAMFTSDPIYPLVRREESELTRWIEYQQKNLGRLSWAAEKLNMRPEDLAMMLGLFDGKPTENHERHSSWFSSLLNRVDDMMSSNGKEEETTSRCGIQDPPQHKHQADEHPAEGSQH